MTKIRLQFVQSFVDQHGKPRFYFRRRGQRRVALPGLPGSAEFMAAYQAALTATPLAIGADKRSGPGSISLALAQYFDSLPFRNLDNGTRVSRKCILEKFRTEHGHLPLASLPREFVVALLDRMTREGVGVDGNWAVDFHQRFDLPDAIRGCDEIESLAPFFVEDPSPHRGLSAGPADPSPESQRAFGRG